MKTFNYSVSQVNHSKERIDEYDKALDIVQASSIRRPTRSLVTFCVSTITVVEMLFFPKFMSDIVESRHRAECALHSRQVICFNSDKQHMRVAHRHVIETIKTNVEALHFEPLARVTAQRIAAACLCARRMSYSEVFNLWHACHLWHFDQKIVTLRLYFYVTLLIQ